MNSNHKKNMIIMDDESYFSLAGDEYSSNSGYYTDNKTLCPIHVKAG